MKYILFLILFLFSCSSFSQKTKSFKFLGGSDTLVKDPFKLRDPFKRKVVRDSNLDKKIRGQLLQNGKYINVPDIENASSDFSIDTLRVTGILLGKRRRAIAKIVSGDGLSKESYILKEGMILGKNKAEVKAILPGGIVLVEKIKNVYDQEEYIETVIPVASEI